MIICLKCIPEKCVLFTVNINACLKVSLSTRSAFGEQLGTWALIIYYYFFYSHQKKVFSKSYLEGTWGFGGHSRHFALADSLSNYSYKSTHDVNLPVKHIGTLFSAGYSKKDIETIFEKTPNTKI